MRPVPVPEAVRGADWVEGTAVFSAPNGDLTSQAIPPAEGLFYSAPLAHVSELPIPMVGVLLVLEDDDMAMIEAGARHVLLSWVGRRMPVFVVPQILGVTS